MRPRPAKRRQRPLTCALATLAALGLSVAVVSSARAESAAPELLSFGNSSAGVLGRRPDEDGDLSSAPTPVALPGQVGTVVQVAAAAHALAVTSAGQLFAIGDNYWGELASARNFRQKLPNPQATLVTLPGTSSPIVQAAAGEGFSLALTAAGQLYAFGADRAGQLGVPPGSGENGNAVPTPTLVPIPMSEGKIMQIAAGTDYSLALSETGRVYSFGENHYGQLGQARNVGSEGPNPTPMPVAFPAGAGPVTQIAAGASHALALTASGQLYGWGENHFGQVGSAPNLGTDKPNSEPHPIALPVHSGAITQIAAGGQDTILLTSAGQVYTSGTNSSGQLGQGKRDRSETPDPTPAPVSLPGESGTAVKIAAGSEENFVQTSGGQLYGFGSNLYGELGVLTNFDDGASYPTPFPLVLPGFSSVAVVGGGADASASFVTAVPQAPPGAPALSGLRMTRRAFELSAHGRRCFSPYSTNRKQRCSRTTPLRIAYTLSESSTVTFVIERTAGSILDNGTCQQEGASRHRAHCSFLVLRGRFRRASAPGAQTFAFDGEIDRRALEPGTYRLTAFAQAGSLAGAAQSVTFEVST
jgi:alpha-tubulin suppressor-like RCC1 family protein